MMLGARRQRFLSTAKDLCLLNGIEADEDVIKTISGSAADHYLKVSDFSYELGYHLPEELLSDAYDIVNIAGAMVSLFLLDEKLQAMCDSWGMEVDNIDFIPEILESVYVSFKHRVREVQLEQEAKDE